MRPCWFSPSLTERKTYRPLSKSSRRLSRPTVRLTKWSRKLAYPINDEPDGYYALYNYTAGPEFPAELERIAKITEGVLRSLVVRKA